jgi:hypothetical protein
MSEKQLSVSLIALAQRLSAWDVFRSKSGDTARMEADG